MKNEIQCQNQTILIMSEKELLHWFHNALPRELRKLILRTWYTDYYRRFCSCGVKKEQIYWYKSDVDKFYRKCCGKICYDIDYEMNYIWPYIDHRIETDILIQLKHLRKVDIQIIDDILEQKGDSKKFMMLHNQVFMECNSLNEEKVYIVIIWQLYKARKRGVPEDRITKVCKAARYLGRYWIPYNRGTLLHKGFFGCIVQDLNVIP